MNTESLAHYLFYQRASHGVSLPQPEDARRFVLRLLGAMFPHFSTRDFVSVADLESELSCIGSELGSLLGRISSSLPSSGDKIQCDFISQLRGVYDLLVADADAIFKGDPAAESVDEVKLAYPGFFATAVYRIAHVLYTLGVPILPRIFTEYAHQVTGIDIHPGATIGKGFCIDHGTGIVVGETTEIQEGVKLYQGVTLGALSVDKGLANKKRHPTIESGVVIYSNATILGGDTVIGEGSIIGGNVWLTASVPKRSTVYHKAEVAVKNQI